MKGRNKVQLIGNLGMDPEISYTPEGKQITKFLTAGNGNCQNGEGKSPQNVGFYTLDKLYVNTIMYVRYIMYIYWPIGRG